METEIEKLNGQIDEQRDEIASLNEKIDEQNDEMKSLYEEIDDFEDKENEHERTKENIADAIKKIKSLLEDIESELE